MPPPRALTPRLPSYHVTPCITTSHQIFVVLRHEVYPKFVNRVMERSRRPARVPIAAAAGEMRLLGIGRMIRKSNNSGTSSPAESTLVAAESQRVSLSESEEVSKAVRAELAKCYY